MNDPTRSAFALVTVVGLALASAACGDSTSDSEDDGLDEDAACDPAFNGPIDPSALVDDLEDGDGLIAQVGSRNGSWWVSTDGTDGIVKPAADMAPAPERILGKRCDSEFAMRVTGADFSEWGAVLSLGFRYVDKEEPVDVSDFDGIMFWARVGEAHSSNVRVQFQDSTTHVEGGLCNPEEGNPEACWDGWGTDVAPLDTEWQLYKIRFDTLTQRDFGLEGESIDLENVYAIDFSLDGNSVFDLWLDDLWLFE